MSRSSVRQKGKTMDNWNSTPRTTGFIVADLENEVGKAGTTDSVALISIGVAVYRAIRALV